MRPNDDGYRTGDLFAVSEETKVRARTTDPETSHRAAAAAAKTINRKQRAVLDTMRRMDAQDFLPAIDETIIKAVRLIMPGMTDSSIRTRRKELTTLGYVRSSGLKGTTEAGGQSIMWELTGKVG